MTEEDKLLEKLINEFPVYLDYVYSNIGLPNSTPLQQRIAEIIGENPNRLILEAARGVGKSWIGAIYTTWRLLRNPDEKILVVSASGPKAIEIATFIRRLFEDVPLLHHLRPTAENRDSVLSFDVAGCKTAIAPSVSALGITSQITGKRASLVLADDVEVPANSATELMREKLIHRTREFEALLIPDMPSSILYLGTPQSMESIYNKIDYPTKILPAEVPEDESVYEGKLDDWVLLQGRAGDATDKVRFPRHVLLERKAGMGLSGFKLQYMLDTTLSDAERFPLKQSDMIVYPCDKAEGPMTISYTSSKEYVLDIPNLGFTGDRHHKPIRVSSDYKKYDKIIMSIDPSGTGTDETTWCVLGVLSGNVYVLDWGGTKLGYSEEALLILALKAQEYKVNEIVPEKNFGAGLFTELFRKTLIKVYPCTIIDDFNVKGQKEARILNNILPLFGNHQIVFNEDKIRDEVEWVQKNPVENLQYSLMYQLTHMTYDKGSISHDDRIDALAIACQYISHMVIVSAEDRLQEIKDREMEEWLMDKIYNKKGRKSRGNILGHTNNYRTKSR
jgi:hypothetical protein